MFWGSCDCIKRHDELAAARVGFWVWVWHVLLCWSGLFDFPSGDSLYKVPLHPVRVEIDDCVGCCSIGWTASVYVCSLLLRSWCVIVIVMTLFDRFSISCVVGDVVGFFCSSFCCWVKTV